MLGVLVERDDISLSLTIKTIRVMYNPESTGKCVD